MQALYSVRANCREMGYHGTRSLWQGLSNTVWSVAKLGAEVNQEVTELLEALAQEAVSQLQDERARAKFIPQNLSNMYDCCLLSLHKSKYVLGDL